MKFVPVSDLKTVRDEVLAYLPLLRQVADASELPLEEHIRELFDGEVQLYVALDENRRVRAIAGTSEYPRGDIRVGRIEWCAGPDRHEWFHFIENLTAYLREQRGCAVVR